MKGAGPAKRDRPLERAHAHARFHRKLPPQADLVGIVESLKREGEAPAEPNLCPKTAAQRELRPPDLIYIEPAPE